MERKKKKEKSGFYIALCCCAVIIAAVGYANRISLVEEKKPEVARVEEKEIIPEATKSPEREVTAPKVKENVEVNNNVVIEEPLRFSLPVDGKIIAEFSGDDLVYNETLKDWRAHCGVDIESKNGNVVVASADGTVEDVFDSEMGRCVIVSHEGGYSSMYANLAEDTTVKKGDKIAKGDKLGVIGNTALGDITEGDHLHFEIMADGRNVNPIEYLD